MAKEYKISKAAGKCAHCDRDLQPGEQPTATVREAGEELLREDYCDSCWQDERREESDLLAVWRTRVPRPQEKKRLLVNDDVIAGFFNRLEGAEEPSKINFRFILALVLMRRKLLAYDRMRKEPDGREVWLMHFRGDETTCEVMDPHMDDDKIAEVSRQLNQIMEVDM